VGTLRVLPLLIAPALLAAQEASTCRPPHTSDSLLVIAYGRLSTFRPADERHVPVWYEEILLQEIARRLRLPQPFHLSAYSTLDSNWIGGKERSRGYPTAFAAMAIVVAENKATPALLTSSAVPAFDKALIEAVRATAGDSAIPPLPDPLKGKQVDFRLRVSMADKPQVGIPLFKARVPVVEFSRMVRPRPGGIGPRYPDELRAKNVEGTVRVQFVIDESGSVLEGTILVLSAAHMLFARSVIDFLTHARFEPAMIGDCPVAVVVEQPFNFALVR
jgi:TonB family protein